MKSIKKIFLKPFLANSSQLTLPFRIKILNFIGVLLISFQVSGQTGEALNFDGVDDRVDLGTTLGNFGTGNFTFETWFKTSATGDRAIVSKRVSCAAGNFWNLRLINGTLHFEVYGTGGISTQSHLSTYNDGIWHHVACVRNNNTHSLYVDGVQVAQNFTGSGADAPFNYNNATSLLIGAGPCGSFSGNIDETRYGI